MKKHLEMPELTNFQMEIVNGSLLGDASISGVRNKNWNWKFTKGQSVSDHIGCDKQTYMNWHMKQLTPYSTKLSKRSVFVKIVNTPNGISNEISLEPYEKYEFTTHCHPCWTKLAKKWYLWENDKPVIKNGRTIKIVPNDLVLTPLTLCVWFMDDGSLDTKNGNATLCTHGFTWEECEFLVKRLNIDLGIVSWVRNESRGYPIIFIGVESFKSVVDLIKPYVAWDCFQYKLDSNYQKIHQSGEYHSQSKITEKDAKSIIGLRKAGISVKDIAKKFNLTSGAISQITSGARWSHLNETCDIKKKPRVTKEQKQKIINLCHLEQKDIANLVGVNQSTVSRILNK